MISTKLGVGDFVVLKDNNTVKYLIVSEPDEKLFEIMALKTGQFTKELKRDCIQFEISNNKEIA